MEFAPGSIRGASTSKAALNGIPVDVLLAPAGWSGVSTFGRFYQRPLNQASSLAELVLP